MNKIGYAALVTTSASAVVGVVTTSLPFIANKAQWTDGVGLAACVVGAISSFTALMIARSIEAQNR